MKKKIFLLVLLLGMAGFNFIGCELADPTNVENPAITQEKLFQDATGGAKPLIVGLRFALADAIGRAVTYTEVISDNYQNTSTFLSTLADNPRSITPYEMQLNDPREIYFKMQTLRALADFGLNTILPKDGSATDADKATIYFYKAMSLLLLSENFSAFPIAENGAMVTAKDALALAVENFNKSVQFDSENSLTAQNQLGLARAYRLLGKKSEAVNAANASINAGNFVFYANYDATNLVNQLSQFTVIRTQFDMKPLPRLDFLDPKCPGQNGDDDLPVLKSEEAYLILAEAALAGGNIGEAKIQMKNAVNVVNSRPVRSYLEGNRRKGRPNASNILVKADVNAPAVSGLIIKRAAGISNDARVVSGTHITEAEIDAKNSVKDLFALLYLLRQEIFFGEGRRMTDLGIRLPIMGRQMEANPNVHMGDYGTSVIVPSYIPDGKGLDQFDFDSVNGIVTITYDMNAILAENINNVSPFLK
ncbi:MAG: hypothetical protein LWX56_09640 [Ignavibacteria bacterium]|nr:hypothetical protein [Ignavibacteria bacterium]